MDICISKVVLCIDGSKRNDPVQLALQLLVTDTLIMCKGSPDNSPHSNHSPNWKQVCALKMMYKT